MSTIGARRGERARFVLHEVAVLGGGDGNGVLPGRPMESIPS